MKSFSDTAGLADAHDEASRISYLPEVREEFAIRSRASDADIMDRIRDTSAGRTMRIVGVLAFGQSLLFLALWLLICASAGAAPTKKAEFNTDLNLSTYEPANQRSPLSKLTSGITEVKAEPGVPVRLQLEGILYDSSNPAAIVNGQVLLVNKVVTLHTDGLETKVRAVEITRNRVVVEVAGRKVELLLKTAGATSGVAKQ